MGRGSRIQRRRFWVRPIIAKLRNSVWIEVFLGARIVSFVLSCLSQFPKAHLLMCRWNLTHKTRFCFNQKFFATGTFWTALKAVRYDSYPNASSKRIAQTGMAIIWETKWWNHWWNNPKIQIGLCPLGTRIGPGTSWQFSPASRAGTGSLTFPSEEFQERTSYNNNSCRS